MRKKTHEEYVAELAIKNPTVEVVGEYVDAKTKILHRCLTHDVCWGVAPGDVLRGGGCSVCRREKLSSFRYKTNQQYNEELASVNADIIALEPYAGVATKILHKCKLHNVEWMISPGSVLYGHGCPKCRSEKIGSKLRKTHVQYVKDLKELNPNICVVEDYIDGSTPILHQCLVDGYEWRIKPNYILNGTGCPKCSNRMRINHDEYVAKLSLFNPDIELVGEYVNMITPVIHRCKTHDVEWNVTPDSVLHGHGCKECGNAKAAEKNRKTHEQYVGELNMVNKDISVLEPYVDSCTPILHRCLIDGHEWSAKPASILSGTGCPRCSESRGERAVRMWLDKNGIQYEFQKVFNDCRDDRPLPFDFYLPNFNACVEYDGEQHFRSVKYFGGEDAFTLRIKHDNIKNNYCEKNNIGLLRIPFFADIEEELNNFIYLT